MKIRSITIWLGMCVLIVRIAAANEAIDIFNASTAGLGVWSCHDANISLQDDTIILGQNNPTVKLGSVVIEDRFAYVQKGVVEVNAEKLIGGTYAFQVLAFKGETFLGTVDLFKDSKRVGIRTFRLGRLALLAGTETVTFKCWLSRAGSVVLNNLRYYVPLKGSAVLYEQQIDDDTECVTEDTIWTPSDNGGEITLAEGVSYGSVLFPGQITKPAQGTLVVETEDVENGTVTVQLLAYDRKGEYLSSLDAVQCATVGTSARLADLEWPPDTMTFKVKVWLGGEKAASAKIKRLVVLR